MLTGSVRAVRDALTAADWPDVCVNPNLAVYTSLYGPFKTLMATNPARGHRRGLQLEPGHAGRDILTQADRWLAEGADALTVQPALQYGAIAGERLRTLNRCRPRWEPHHARQTPACCPLSGSYTALYQPVIGGRVGLSGAPRGRRA